uniref:Uncharacterized protein n=1 Tax=Podoviridae sp. ctBev14 TaxID=2823556 RepID=A0A8S5LB83_9CAUD|nr:MAG TPA: hypothetical protein [Podoviridae sp. ctBev14]
MKNQNIYNINFPNPEKIKLNHTYFLFSLVQFSIVYRSSIEDSHVSFLI